MDKGIAKRIGVVWKTPLDRVRKGIRLQAFLRRQHITPGARCVYCQSQNNLTIDHIIRRTWAKGFDPNAPENIQVLCDFCHKRKFREEQIIQNRVMMRSLTVEEGLVYLRSWAPSAKALRPAKQPAILTSKWQWRWQRSLYVKTGSFTIGIMFFGKKARH